MPAGSVRKGSAPKTREEFVADRLREAIQRGDLRPGEKLDEGVLADLLGVTRTPVRGALRILAGERLVAIQPHRGSIVVDLPPGELEDIYLIRGILEGKAARLAAPQISDEHIAALKAVLERLETTTDLDRWLDANDEFHHIIYSLIRRPRLLSVIAYVRNISGPYIRQFIGSAENMRISQAGHRQIFEACERRDGALAERAVQEHMDVVCQANLTYVESISTES